MVSFTYRTLTRYYSFFGSLTMGFLKKRPELSGVYPHYYADPSNTIVPALTLPSLDCSRAD